MSGTSVLSGSPTGTPLVPPPPVQPVPVSPTIVVALPPTIPPSWISDIRSAISSDRPSAILTVLGSAVLAAVIGAGSSILTAWVTARASEDLEIRKSQLELSRSDITESLRSYDALEKRLEELREDFTGVATLVRIAGPNSVKSQKDGARMRSEISGVGTKMGEVLALRSDFHIDQDTWAQLNKVLNEIAQSISDSETNWERFADRSDGITTDLDTAIEKVHAKRAQQSAQLSSSTHP